MTCSSKQIRPYWLKFKCTAFKIMRLILVSSFLVDFVLNWCCNQFVELSTPGKTCHWCIRSLTFSVTCRSKISWGNFQHGLHRLLCRSVVYTGCGCKLRRWAFFFSSWLVLNTISFAIKTAGKGRKPSKSKSYTRLGSFYYAKKYRTFCNCKSKGSPRQSG